MGIFLCFLHNKNSYWSLTYLPKIRQKRYVKKGSE